MAKMLMGLSSTPIFGGLRQTQVLERRSRRGRHPRLGAVVGVQPLFEAIKWASIAYLAFLAIEALRSAAAGRLPFDHEKTRPSVRSRWRQGFVSNITNPKITGKHAGKPAVDS
jgi:hypothetical protein